MVLLSPASKKSNWVRLELTYAQEFGLTIFPILVFGDNRTSVPISLSDTQYADATRNFATGIADLLKSLDEFHAGRDPFAVARSFSFINYRHRDVDGEALLVFDRMTQQFGKESVFSDMEIYRSELTGRNSFHKLPQTQSRICS